MEEKLIVIIDLETDEILDSFEKIYSGLGIHFYCIHNNLRFVQAYEFCSFIAVIVEFK